MFLTYFSIPSWHAHLFWLFFSRRVDAGSNSISTIRNLASAMLCVCTRRNTKARL